MKKYCITEKQNLSSARGGYEVTAMSLSGAKVKASRGQVFKDTVLTIEQDGVLLAYKENGKWTNA